MPEVTSVNVGQVREVTWRGRRIRTGIWRTPIDTLSVIVRGVNLDGDHQADRRVHGGPDEAVYAYALEDYDFWQQVEELAVTPGLFGENLTVRGSSCATPWSGRGDTSGRRCSRWRSRGCPASSSGSGWETTTFRDGSRKRGGWGAYLSIINEGVVAPSDAVEVSSRPEHGVTLRGMLEALGDQEKLRGLLRAPELSAYWRGLAERA